MTSKVELTDNTRKYLECLDEVARPLIRSGAYASEEDFLRDFVKDFAQRKVEENRQVVLGFEKQYISWEKFTDALLDVATPEQEDEWWEWEAARDRQVSWQELLDELT